MKTFLLKGVDWQQWQFSLEVLAESKSDADLYGLRRLSGYRGLEEIPSADTVETQMLESFRTLGMSEAGARAAVAGRSSEAASVNVIVREGSGKLTLERRAGAHPNNIRGVAPSTEANTAEARNEPGIVNLREVTPLVDSHREAAHNEQSITALVECFRQLGMTEEAAQTAARGRA